MEDIIPVDTKILRGYLVLFPVAIFHAIILNGGLEMLIKPKLVF